MTRTFRLVLIITFLFTSTILVHLGCTGKRDGSSAPRVVHLGISPFQDTLLPLIGERRGWYRAEGLDVKLHMLGWTEVMEALSAGRVDVAISNCSAVISTHPRNPEIVYFYALNPFDNGFALMIRPHGPLKTLDDILRTVPDRAAAVRLTAQQLKGRKVITTSRTDMEQGVAAAARRGGLDFRRDIRILDLNPDEGLAAFLSGEVDAYIGGIPQRTRAKKEGATEMLTGADLGPPPLNGFVTTRRFLHAHPSELLALVHVWFRSVNSMNANMEHDAPIIIEALNAASGAQFTVADFRTVWNNYEHFVASAREAQDVILSPRGRNYWRARWDDTNDYFFRIIKTIPAPVRPEDAFLMPAAQKAYLKRYGTDG